MEHFVEILISLIGKIFDGANLFFASFSGNEIAILSGGSLSLAFAAVGAPIMEGTLAAARRWHGSITDQFANIDSLFKMVTKHQADWNMPADLLTQLTENRNQLETLIDRCRSNEASRVDREHRNALLKSTVGLCLLQIKIWVYGKFTDGTISAEDVHLLGFLLPNEHGGKRERVEATDVLAEVKVKVINGEFIRVVIDQSADENAALVNHGWPTGVKNALIVITAVKGNKEVYRQITTTLHNDIRMPDGLHGEQFVIKAAFLRHVNDEPRFGNEPTFSMPLTTGDLAAALDRQHHEDFEEHMREIERQRQEIERLQAEINAGKK